jgi:hypothetical protein
MSDMTETNRTDPCYYSPSCIPRIIKSHVEELFKKDAPFRRGELRRNPVHAGWFVHGEDPIAPQKRVARRALLAREWFYEFGPRDAPPLPVSGYEIEDMRFAHKFGSRAGFYHLIAHFARSLWCNDWDFNIHPTFEDFASSMLASDYAADFLRKDEELCKRYPPRALCTIVPGGFWKPPRANENNRRTIARRK